MKKKKEIVEIAALWRQSFPTPPPLGQEESFLLYQESMDQHQEPKMKSPIPLELTKVALGGSC